MIYDPKWEKREPVEIEMEFLSEEDKKTIEQLATPVMQLQGCPWCNVVATPAFMTAHIQEHEQEQVTFIDGLNAQDRTILVEVGQERVRQDEKWGEQNHADGTGEGWVYPLLPFRMRADEAVQIVEMAKRHCERKALGEKLTFQDILIEEIAEAFAETDDQALRVELVQCAAVIVNWIGAIDRRGGMNADA